MGVSSGNSHWGEGEAWAEAYARGQRAWPMVQLPYARFVRHITDLGYSTAVPAHARDLFLAAAALNGSAQAYQAMDEQHVVPQRAAIARIVRDASVDDILQELRERLFTGKAPKIACYLGHGPLHGWIRAAAINLALDHTRAEHSQRQRVWAQIRLDPVCTIGTPRFDCGHENAIARQEHVLECRGAIRRSIWKLTPKERRLLINYFVAGMSIDVLGQLYGVHRSTIARRISRVTRHIREAVKSSLRARFGWDASSVREALGMVASIENDGNAASLFESGWLTPGESTRQPELDEGERRLAS